MDFNEYQREAAKTAIYPGRGEMLGLTYLGLGLGEAGEVQGKIKKMLRDDNGVIDALKAVEIRKELGDILWYVAEMATTLQTSLELIAEDNIYKLKSRQERGVLSGSGDNR